MYQYVHKFPNVSRSCGQKRAAVFQSSLSTLCHNDDDDDALTISNTTCVQQISNTLSLFPPLNPIAYPVTATH